MIKQKGFTLVEVIMTIAVLAVAAAMLVAVFRTQLLNSASPATQVQNQYLMIQRMENITSFYRNEVGANTIQANWANFVTFCTNQGCTCNERTDISGYTTARNHLQVACTSGVQTVFAIFTQ